jgi:hypothetical protein
MINSSRSTALLSPLMLTVVSTLVDKLIITFVFLGFLEDLG